MNFNQFCITNSSVKVDVFLHCSRCNFYKQELKFISISTYCLFAYYFLTPLKQLDYQKKTLFDVTIVLVIICHQQTKIGRARDARCITTEPSRSWWHSGSTSSKRADGLGFEPRWYHVCSNPVHSLKALIGAMTPNGEYALIEAQRPETCKPYFC